jgi:Fuc2NAc and GlcNAc transferase
MLDALLRVELKIFVVSALVFAASALLTGVVRHFAAASGLVDVPNPRSSHSRITARGGGLAVVAAATAGVIALFVMGVVSRDLVLTVVIGGGLVALIGFLDDRYSVQPAVRFVVHAVAALWALFLLGGLPPLLVGDHLVKLGASGYLIGALGISWVLNLFNFMDGIDGLASSEAIFIALAGAVLTPALGVGLEVAVVALVVAAASGGFLLWNWPPARIFLGDVGSGYLGYLVAVLALSASRDNPAAPWVWLILGGAFFVDATVTLLRRFLRRERLHEAHRSHAYQNLARHWSSHAKVTVAVLGVNLIWLLPWALLAARRPRYAAAAVIVALAPLAILAIVCGAGRAED